MLSFWNFWPFQRNLLKNLFSYPGYFSLTGPFVLSNMTFEVKKISSLHSVAAGQASIFSTNLYSNFCNWRETTVLILDLLLFMTNFWVWYFNQVSQRKTSFGFCSFFPSFGWKTQNRCIWIPFRYWFWIRLD